MPTYIIKRDGLVVGACTSEEAVGALPWFHTHVSYSMEHAIAHEGYSVHPLITRKDFWALHDAEGCDRKALHHEYNAQFLNDRVRELVIRRIGKGRIEASQDEWFNDIPLREWDALNDSIKDLCNHDVRREIEPVGKGYFMWSLSHAVSIAKCVAREVRNAYQSKAQKPDGKA